MAVSWSNKGSIHIAESWLLGIAENSAVIGLFQSGLSPTRTTTAAEFETNKANFTGYVAQSAETWLAPYLAPSGGATVTLPTVQFNYTGDGATGGNLIGGWYLRLGSSPGNVLAYGTFDDVIPMQVPGQALPLNLGLTFGT